jgi:hypothetical protein
MDHINSVVTWIRRGPEMIAHHGGFGSLLTADHPVIGRFH